MKFSYVSAAAALAMASVLAGCGGKAQFTVQGTIYDAAGVQMNMPNSGLVLANGSDTVTVPLGANSFSFPKQIDYGTEYNITVKTQPAHMTCIVSAGSGSAGHNIAIKAAVQCTQNSYSLGGQYTGITVSPTDGTTARTVTLINGSGGSIILSSANATNGAGDFAFSTPVLDGQAYGVTVVDPANGLSCTLQNGTGIMHEAAVSNLLLTCVQK